MKGSQKKNRRNKMTVTTFLCNKNNQKEYKNEKRRH